MHPLPVVSFWNQEAFIVQISSSSHTKVNNFLLFDFYLETLLETYSTHLVLDYCSTTNTGCWLQHMPSHDFNTRSQTGPILFIYWIWSVYLLKEVFAVQYMCDPHLGNQHASVKIDESGWAWLVTGRKLFIWRYSPTSGAKVSVKIDIPVSCT